MTALPDLFKAAASAALPSDANAPAPRTAISPLTLRLTKAERARLEELAAGMTLSAYIRACVFAEDAKLRKHRPADARADKKAAAEALALLGQSRIASNLNQLAHHANIGILGIGDTEKAQIEEAYEHVLAIRKLLMEALGKQSNRSSALSGFDAAKYAAFREARTRPLPKDDILSRRRG